MAAQIMEMANRISEQYSINPLILQIAFGVISVAAIFLAIKLVRKIFKIIFMLIALFSIAMSLYGEQIMELIIKFISSKI